MFCHISPIVITIAVLDMEEYLPTQIKMMVSSNCNRKQEIAYRIRNITYFIS